MYYFQRAADRSDFDWNVQLSFLWASITAGVGIISASVPMLKPILARYVPSIIGEHRKCSRSSDDARNSFQSEHTNNKDQHQNHHPHHPHHQHHHQHDLHLHFHSHHSRHSPEPTSNNFLRPPELSDPGRRLSRTSRATTFHHNPADLSALSGKPATQWLAIIAVLFFSWGVAQGLLGSLVGKFDAAYGLTDAEKGGLNGSYFG